MKTINDSHLKAIARAIHFVRSGITKNMSPKLLDSIEHDIMLLNETHKFCRQQITEPGLPMCNVPESVMKVGESIGNAHTQP